jgi:hypothetical protein
MTIGPPQLSAYCLSRGRRIIRRGRVAAALSWRRRQRERPTLRAHNRQLAAIATPAPEEEATGWPDPIIDAVMARAIHADAVRTHLRAAWVIVRDQIAYPGDVVARLITDELTPYVLLADGTAAGAGHRQRCCHGAMGGDGCEG